MKTQEELHKANKESRLQKARRGVEGHGLDLGAAGLLRGRQYFLMRYKGDHAEDWNKLADTLKKG